MKKEKEYDKRCETKDFNIIPADEIEIIQKLKRDENAEYTLRFEYKNKKYVRAVKNDKNQLKDVYYEIKESELEEVKNQNLLDAFNAKYKHDANPILY